MRVAIVNDMSMAVRVLQQVVSTIKDVEIAWIAKDGEEAVGKCIDDRPDLILMDLIMPKLNGVESTRKIMKEAPCPILIVTSSVHENASMVFEAMGAGALDAVSTPITLPSGGIKDEEHGLKMKIATIRKLIRVDTKETKEKSARINQRIVNDQWLCVIGASTGGPNALAVVLGGLPKDLNAAVIIIQHVDQHFAPGLVEWLNEKSQLPVYLAKTGDQLTSGKVWVAGSNDHLILDGHNRLAYTRDPSGLVYRPSVNVFYDSVVDNWHGKSVGVLLTGMGADGANGLLRMKKSGIYTIAQDKDTCAVYGMPKAAAELGAADIILPLSEIAREINRVIMAPNIITGAYGNE